MKKPIKFFAAIFITLLFSLSAFTMNAYAEENTLGLEEPYLYCEFFNEDDEKVDGNTLPSGEYTVNVMLDGISSISVFQYTAEYDTSVVTALSTTVQITQDYPDLSLGGTKTTDLGNGNSRFVLALASTDDACTALDQGGAVTVASMTVTVDCGENVIDFINCFRFVTDPDLTFIEADYNDGIEDAYVLDTAQTTTYNTYPMFADESPAENELEPDITVSGTVVIANTVTGGGSSYGARGVYFKVDGEYLTDDQDNRIATSEEAGHYGEFTITLPAGTTSFQVVPGLSEKMARTVTVNVDDSYEGAVIPVHYADYNNDGKCNGVDYSLYRAYLKNYNYYGDYNIDNKCNGVDTSLYRQFINKTLSYDELVLE